MNEEHSYLEQILISEIHFRRSLLILMKKRKFSTHGSEMWHLSKKMERKIRTTKNSMERWILNINKKDNVKISTIKSKLTNKCAIRMIKNKNWWWRGYVARLQDNRWTYKLNGKEKAKETVGQMEGLLWDFTETQNFPTDSPGPKWVEEAREAFARF